MNNFNENIISDKSTIRQALACLDKIGVYGNVLFVIDENNIVLGTITDGDIRRGLLKDLNVNSFAIEAAQTNFHFIENSETKDNLNSIKRLKIENIKLVPLVDVNKKLIKIINVDNFKGFLPIDVFILAGGKGVRLLPLTKECPKPMLIIGDKPIIEHNIDRLISYGINNITISINYLGHIIENYFENGAKKSININYVRENKELGTIGSISLATSFKNDYILVINSDLLTDIDFANLFDTFIESDSDLIIATTPYYVDIPYAVLEINEENHVKALMEKPKYTYYSNAGIYLIKKEALNKVPYNQFYNATDLIEEIIKNGGVVTSFPILSYWLDIGKMPDFIKAQEDIKYLKL